MDTPVGRQNPGVVDDDVDPTELVERSMGQTTDTLLVAYVDLADERAEQGRSPELSTKASVRRSPSAMPAIPSAAKTPRENLA